ncbi:MAG: peptidylprolyl isomerase [Lentimicrobiaceae bacterium]|nr:peptidylprolyl isomerase [Lentimicrobiaceae bacterium]
MKNVVKKLFILLLCVAQWGAAAQSSKNVIDEIIATVGNRIITRSDLEYAFQSYRYSSGMYTLENTDEIRCNILEQLMFQKLLVNQAELDSIEVTDGQINERIDYNLRTQIMQVGGDSRKLEEYYGKSIAEIKADAREQMRDDFLADEMQRKLTQGLNVINQEIKDYFYSIPQDSLPIIATEYELAQIVKIPVISEEERIAIKEKLNSWRERALKGENFSTFARMYSEDPGSASKGGDIGFTERGDLYPEFEAEAYNLKPGEISLPVETEAGFHIIRMLERRGDRINVAHILLKPKPSPEEMTISKNFLDSVYNLLKENKISFDSAAMLFSDDKNKISGGMLINPFTASHAFQKEHFTQYDKTILYVIDDLKEGDFSRPMSMITESGNQAYRILYMKAKRPEHKASLLEDYEKIKNAAMENKRQKLLLKWVHNKVKYTHIKVHSDFKNCEFLREWGVESY